MRIGRQQRKEIRKALRAHPRFKELNLNLTLAGIGDVLAACELLNIDPLNPQASLLPVTASALAEMLGVSRTHVYNCIYRGDIRATHIGGSIVIMPDEVRRVREAAIWVTTPYGQPRLVIRI